MFLTYVACLLALYFVLVRWSADDVRSDSETVLEYFTALATGLVMMQEVFRWCGVSVRGDAIERRNPVAAIVGAAQIVAMTFCLAGSNIGMAPGRRWWRFVWCFQMGRCFCFGWCSIVWRVSTTR